MSSSVFMEAVGEQGVMALEYVDVGDRVPTESGSVAEEKESQTGVYSEEELRAIIKREREEATAEAQEQAHAERERQLNKVRDAIREAIQKFECQRSEYFAQVEVEVVHLALSIAAKILRREAQVDPMLIPALARLAIQDLRGVTAVSIRICPEQEPLWRGYLEEHTLQTLVEIVADVHLGADECVLETPVGTTQLGVAAQLKEVEQGLLELLALRPEIR